MENYPFGDIMLITEFVSTFTKSNQLEIVKPKHYLTVTVRDDYSPHDTRWQYTARIFIMACLDAYMKSDINHVFQVPKIRSKKV